MKIIYIEDSSLRSQICEKILRSLPDWFGIESAILDYIRDVPEMDTWIASEGEVPVGFVSIKKHNSISAEVYVMGVLPKYHRSGVGRSLLQEAEMSLRISGFKYLTVKTLSESRPNKEYELTRKFYLSAGFEPVEEFKTLWNEDNPCLQLIKNIALPGGLHHIEIYVSNLESSTQFWTWLLCEQLGYQKYQQWNQGISYILGNTYIVFVQTEERFLKNPYHRCHVGLNHLAFHGNSRHQIDQLTVELKKRGCTILYENRHPHAGGSDTYAVFFEDPDRIKVELVAR